MISSKRHDETDAAILFCKKHSLLVLLDSEVPQDQLRAASEIVISALRSWKVDLKKNITAVQKTSAAAAAAATSAAGGGGRVGKREIDDEMFGTFVQKSEPNSPVDSSLLNKNNKTLVPLNDEREPSCETAELEEEEEEEEEQDDFDLEDGDRRKRKPKMFRSPNYFFSVGFLRFRRLAHSRFRLRDIIKKYMKRKAEFIDTALTQWRELESTARVNISFEQYVLVYVPVKMRRQVLIDYHCAAAHQCMLFLRATKIPQDYQMSLRKTFFNYAYYQREVCSATFRIALVTLVLLQERALKRRWVRSLLSPEDSATEDIVENVVATSAAGITPNVNKNDHVVAFGKESRVAQLLLSGRTSPTRWCKSLLSLQSLAWMAAIRKYQFERQTTLMRPRFEYDDVKKQRIASSALVGGGGGNHSSGAYPSSYSSSASFSRASSTASSVCSSTTSSSSSTVISSTSTAEMELQLSPAELSLAFAPWVNLEVTTCWFSIHLQNFAMKLLELSAQQKLAVEKAKLKRELERERIKQQKKSHNNKNKKNKSNKNVQEIEDEESSSPPIIKEEEEEGEFTITSKTWTKFLVAPELFDPFNFVDLVGISEEEKLFISSLANSPHVMGNNKADDDDNNNNSASRKRKKNVVMADSQYVFRKQIRYDKQAEQEADEKNKHFNSSAVVSFVDEGEGRKTKQQQHQQRSPSSSPVLSSPSLASVSLKPSVRIGKDGALINIKKEKKKTSSTSPTRHHKHHSRSTSPTRDHHLHHQQTQEEYDQEEREIVLTRLKSAIANVPSSPTNSDRSRSPLLLSQQRDHQAHSFTFSSARAKKRAQRQNMFSSLIREQEQLERERQEREEEEYLIMQQEQEEIRQQRMLARARGDVAHAHNTSEHAIQNTHSSFRKEVNSLLRSKSLRLPSRNFRVSSAFTAVAAADSSSEPTETHGARVAQFWGRSWIVDEYWDRSSTIRNVDQTWFNDPSSGGSSRSLYRKILRLCVTTGALRIVDPYLARRIQRVNELMVQHRAAQDALKVLNEKRREKKLEALRRAKEERKKRALLGGAGGDRENCYHSSPSASFSAASSSSFSSYFDQINDINKRGVSPPGDAWKERSATPTRRTLLSSDQKEILNKNKRDDYNVMSDVQIFTRSSQKKRKVESPVRCELFGEISHIAPKHVLGVQNVRLTNRPSVEEMKKQQVSTSSLEAATSRKQNQIVFETSSSSSFTARPASSRSSKSGMKKSLLQQQRESSLSSSCFVEVSSEIAQAETARTVNVAPPSSIPSAKQLRPVIRGASANRMHSAYSSSVCSKPLFLQAQADVPKCAEAERKTLVAAPPREFVASSSSSSSSARPTKRRSENEGENENVSSAAIGTTTMMSIRQKQFHNRQDQQKVWLDSQTKEDEDEKKKLEPPQPFGFNVGFPGIWRALTKNEMETCKNRHNPTLNNPRPPKFL